MVCAWWSLLLCTGCYHSETWPGKKSPGLARLHLTFPCVLGGAVHYSTFDSNSATPWSEWCSGTGVKPIRCGFGLAVHSLPQDPSRASWH